MARFIRVEGARSAANAAALLPPPNRTPVASTSGVVVSLGAPGTLRIPTPRPSGIPQTLSRRLTGLQPTNVGPTYMLPRLFTNTPNRNILAGGRSRGELPVPALGYLRIPQPTTRRPNPLGNRVIAWPKAMNRPYVIGGRQGRGTGA